MKYIKLISFIFSKIDFYILLRSDTVNAILKGTFILLSSLFMVGCSIKSVEPEDVQIDRAIKSCTLGYEKSEEVNLAFMSAYKYADKNYNLDFKASMKESLTTSIMTYASTSKDNNSKEVIELIKRTQDCVIQKLDANRPLTRGDLLKQCRDDIQARLSGYGNGGPVVRNHEYVPDHLDNSDTTLVMNAFIDYKGSNSFRGTYLCKIQDNKYIDFIMLKRSLAIYEVPVKN